MVVGGGLTGCACAAALAAARVPVVLVEAGQIGSGATAGAVGLVREDFDVSFTATTSASRFAGGAEASGRAFVAPHWISPRRCDGWRSAVT